ncbi:MAG: RNA polymerase sigma-70 factor [Sphingobacterium sp.]|jgi:RNA polymerase sigma-70 factor (ECF subfamily)|nr:RNA polymerase sigma-70 factor [Sphingobacterium sp.]
MKNYSEYSEEELVTLLKQKDHAAFTEIHNRYSPQILAQTNRMLRDIDVAKDMVQELFLTLWRRVDYIRVDGKIGGYLYVATQNLVLKYIQRAKFQNNYLASLAQFSTELQNSTSELLDEKEIRSLLNQNINQLPDKTRKIFELSRTSNLSYREIAEQLGFAEQTVKNQISIALKMLKEKMAPHKAGLILIIALLMICCSLNLLFLLSLIYKTTLISVAINPFYI